MIHSIVKKKTDGDGVITVKPPEQPSGVDDCFVFASS